MRTQLFFDLVGETRHISVHFCEPHQMNEVRNDLLGCDIALFEIVGTQLSSQEAVFKAFAIALKMPAGWYGDEEYATNVNAFLEYLDDVVEWVPAKGHVVVIRDSEQFWRAEPRLAGDLVEWWQLATYRQATIHLVFVW